MSAVWAGVRVVSSLSAQARRLATQISLFFERTRVEYLGKFEAARRQALFVGIPGGKLDRSAIGLQPMANHWEKKKSN